MTVIIMIVIILFGGIVTYQQMKYTTYEEAVSNLLSSEKGEIGSIEIVSFIYRDTVLSKSATIEDEQLIKTFLEEPSNMRLKRDNNDTGLLKYVIYINIPETYNTYSIYLYEDHIYIGDKQYQVVSNHHLLEKLIENEEFIWINNYID